MISLLCEEYERRRRTHTTSFRLLAEGDAKELKHVSKVDDRKR